MAALGFNRQETVDRYSNTDYTVWDLNHAMYSETVK